MSTQREQLTGSVMFLLLIAAGWGPYFFATATSGIHTAPVVMLGGFFAILAAGFTYDAAEKLFGAGKGVYAAAAQATFPPAAIVFSEPPFLAETSLMFVTAAAVWFAARATHEQSREALFFIAILSAIVLTVFGFWPPAFLPLVSLFVLRKKANASVRAMFIAAVVGLLGLGANAVLRLGLPKIMGQQPDLALSVFESAVLLAPWLGFAIVALFVKTEWARALIIGSALLTLLHAQFGGDWVGAVGAASPLLALSMTAVVLRWFHAESEAGLRVVRWCVAPLVLVLVGILASRILESDAIVTSRNFAVLGAIVAALLVVSAVKDGRRWIFALHAGAGLYVGALWWYYWSETGLTPLDESSFDIVPWVLVAGVLARVFVGMFYGRRMPRRLREAGPRHRFDNLVFRSFKNVRRKTWEGDAVDVSPADPTHVRFAIFGDVTGSESPFASRNSGYYAFQKIVGAIANRKPDFAVSTGDLATRATHLAYRRLRVLLRKLPFPLIATPGNHDVVHYNNVQPQFFHALFGTNHGEITVGSVRLILIDNALGNITDEQWPWIESTLAAPSSAASTLVFCHKPIFDPRENTYYGMEVREHAERLHDLFVKHGVTAVFSGHIHSLLHTEKDGVTYIISGGGGSRLKSKDDAHHYLWCEAKNAGVSVTAFGIDSSEPLLSLALSRKP